MELNLDNLVNEIIKQESIYHDHMLESENLFGRESNNFRFWKSKWIVLHNFAVKFDFEDKLKR